MKAVVQTSPILTDEEWPDIPSCQPSCSRRSLLLVAMADEGTNDREEDGVDDVDDDDNIDSNNNNNNNNCFFWLLEGPFNLATSVTRQLKMAFFTKENVQLTLSLPQNQQQHHHHHHYQSSLPSEINGGNKQSLPSSDTTPSLPSRPSSKINQTEQHHPHQEGETNNSVPIVVNDKRASSSCKSSSCTSGNRSNLQQPRRRHHRQSQERHRDHNREWRLIRHDSTGGSDEIRKRKRRYQYHPQNNDVAPISMTIDGKDIFDENEQARWIRFVSYSHRRQHHHYHHNHQHSHHYVQRWNNNNNTNTVSRNSNNNNNNNNYSSNCCCVAGSHTDSSSKRTTTTTGAVVVVSELILSDLRLSTHVMQPLFRLLYYNRDHWKRLVFRRCLHNRCLEQLLRYVGHGGGGGDCTYGDNGDGDCRIGRQRQPPKKSSLFAIDTIEFHQPVYIWEPALPGIEHLLLPSSSSSSHTSFLALSELKLSDMTLSQEQAMVLGTSIAASKSCLRGLHLMDVRFVQWAMWYLSDGIGRSSSLESLTVTLPRAMDRQSSFAEPDVILLALSRPNGLDGLVPGDNVIGTDINNNVEHHSSRSCAPTTSSRLKTLTISINMIDSSWNFGTALATYLTSSRCRIETLSLTSPPTTYLSMMEHLRLLKQGELYVCPTLTTLFFHDASWQDHGDYHAQAQVLNQLGAHFPNLTELDISHNRFFIPAYWALAKAPYPLLKLQSLYIMEPTIDARGIGGRGWNLNNPGPAEPTTDVVPQQGQNHPNNNNIDDGMAIDNNLDGTTDLDDVFGHLHVNHPEAPSQVLFAILKSHPRLRTLSRCRMDRPMHQLSTSMTAAVSLFSTSTASSSVCFKSMSRFWKGTSFEIGIQFLLESRQFLPLYDSHDVEDDDHDDDNGDDDQEDIQFDHNGIDVGCDGMLQEDYYFNGSDDDVCRCHLEEYFGAVGTSDTTRQGGRPLAEPKWSGASTVTTTANTKFPFNVAHLWPIVFEKVNENASPEVRASIIHSLLTHPSFWSTGFVSSSVT